MSTEELGNSRLLQSSFDPRYPCGTDILVCACFLEKDTFAQARVPVPHNQKQVPADLTILDSYSFEFLPRTDYKLLRDVNGVRNPSNLAIDSNGALFNLPSAISDGVGQSR